MRLLSIDGGGIRGLIPASVLVELEAMLQDRQGPGARLADHFDLFAGTSTGGLIAGLLLLPGGGDRRPSRTAQDVVDFYVDRASTLFRRSPVERITRFGGLADERYGSEGFNENLDAVLGPRDGSDPEPMLSGLLRPTVIPTYNATTDSPYFFKQHEAAAPGGHDFTVRDVALATAAAPTYFEAVPVRSGGEAFGACVDGGLFANNPAMCAFVEARSAFGHEADDLAVLSLGTGSLRVTRTHEEMRDWGLATWVSPLIDMMMAGSGHTVDHQMRQLFAAVDDGATASPYLRLQADLTVESEDTALMDNPDPANLDRLVEIGRELVDEHRAALEIFVDTQLLGGAATLQSGQAGDGGH